MKPRLLETDQIYHVFTKSISDFKVFNYENEYLRMFETLTYYQYSDHLVKFSDRNENCSFASVKTKTKTINESDKLVNIIAYCLMPTHLHLILKQLKESGISLFISNVLNSYTRYFNIKLARKGPLWEGRFKNVLVATDEQLLHLTRYIHLNPVTAYLVNTPEEWPWSSYNEYLSLANSAKKTCNFEDLLEINPDDYRKFVKNMILDQRELAKIKSLIKE
jgi:putative transposase